MLPTEWGNHTHWDACAQPPDGCCRPNAARDVSRPVGTRGGVGWMRGPCQRVSRNPWRTRHSPGQAPGPHPSPHPPLVPTERRGRTRPDGRDSPLRLEKFIRTQADLPTYSPIRLSKFIRVTVQPVKDSSSQLNHALDC